MADMFGFKIITQYEQGIVFHWGRALPGVRQPGLTWVNPFADRLRKINMQVIVASVPGQEAITRDNVTLKVDAVVYYRVIDAVKAAINVQDYAYAVSQVAQTSLRAVIGTSDLDQLLSIDVARWRQEMGFREQHLAQFDGLPEEIWAAHRRVAAALDAEPN